MTFFWIILGIIVIVWLTENEEAIEIADDIGTDDIDDIEEIQRLLDEGDDDAIERIRETGDIAGAYDYWEEKEFNEY